MKCTWPARDQTLRTHRKLYSTGWRWGLASRITQILSLGNAKIYQHVGISNAKFWHRGHCPTPTPDARYFAFWWNKGLTFLLSSSNPHILKYPNFFKTIFLLFQFNLFIQVSNSNTIVCSPIVHLFR